jgi:uncharacterized protein DUF4406
LKCYLAGRIHGEPQYHEKFAEAAQWLRVQGFDVFNPAAANQEGRSLKHIMAYLLPCVCEAEVIAMLPGWKKSGGARIEWLLARYLKLKIIYLK